MFSFFCGISGVVSEYINCRLIIVLDNERLVSDKIFGVSLEIRPPHSIWESFLGNILVSAPPT